MKIITFLLCLMFSLIGFAQDNCVTAVPITVGTLEAIEVIDGPEVPTPDCTQFGQATTTASEWYVYTATVTGVATITSNLPENTGGDTRVSVYTGSCDALECFATADDISYPNNTLSTIVFTIDAGDVFYIAWDNQWSNNGHTFLVTEEASNCVTSIPYDESFNSVANATVCYTKQGDGNSSFWRHEIFDANQDGTNESLFSIGSDGLNEKDDYLFSPAFTLESGVTYDITYKYNAVMQGPVEANETFGVLITDAPTSVAAFSQQINLHEGILQSGAFAAMETDAMTSTATFTAVTDGDYHIGFHAMSPAQSAFLVIFDYQITPSLSAPQFETEKISMYPNPVVNELNVATQNAIDSVEVYNLMGQKVLGQTYGANEVKVDMSQLSSGAYMVKVFSGNASSIVKVVKQ